MFPNLRCLDVGFIRASVEPRWTKLTTVSLFETCIHYNVALQTLGQIQKCIPSVQHVYMNEGLLKQMNQFEFPFSLHIR